MKGPLNRKRRCFAWLLLFAFCLQRIIGFVGSEIVYVVEAEARMNEKEEAIAEKIKIETGFDIHIEIRGEGQIKALQDLGYSSPFIFSEEIDGQAYYYTLNESPVKAVSLTYTTTGHQKPEAPSRAARALKDRLFSDFYFWEAGLPSHEFPGRHSWKKAFPSFWENPFLSIKSPPPEVA